MRKISFLFFLLTAITTFSWGQNLDDYLIQAGENNPELQAYYHEYLASLEKAPQVGSLPDPELTMGVFFSPMQRWMGNQVADFKLMQMFPWFGTLGEKKEEANLLSHARYQLFLDAKNKLFYQVKSTYFEIYQTQKEIQIQKQFLEHLEQFERLALAKFKSGSNEKSTGMPGMGSSESGMSGVLDIRIQYLEKENEILTLEENLKPLQIKFNQLLNREINEQISSLDSLEPSQLLWDKNVLLDSIQSQNPMLASFDTQMAALDQQEQIAKLQGRPMLGAGIEYMPFQPRPESGMMMGGKDMVMPMVSLSLPIYRKKTNSRIKETEYLREATLLKKEKEENMLAMEWANAIRDFEDASRKIDLYQEQMELVHQNNRLQLSYFQTNSKSIESVVSSHHQMLQIQLSQLRMIVQQHKSLALLESLGTGTPIN